MADTGDFEVTPEEVVETATTEKEADPSHHDPDLFSLDDDQGSRPKLPSGRSDDLTPTRKRPREEDLESDIGSLAGLRDSVRECLEKDPSERTEDDVEVLLDLMGHLPVMQRDIVALG